MFSSVFVPWGNGLLAFLVAVGLTPLVRWGARRGGWVEEPEDGKWHDAPTALMGGIAIVTAGAIVLSIGTGGTAVPGAVWAGAGLLFVTGLIDDLWALGPTAKLTAQLASAGLALFAGLLFAPGAPLWVSIPLTLVWLLGIPNAVNLLDAMDGIAASVTALAAVFLGLIAGMQGQVALATVAAVLAGAAAGFLVFNVAPASIFMGDCGSLVLGYVLAVLGLGVQGPDAGGSALISVLVLAVPIFDTTFVSVTRTRRGDSVTNGGVDHTMHRLVRLGWSERQVMLLLCSGGLLAGGVGLIEQAGPMPLFYALVLGVVGTAFGIGWLLVLQTAPTPEAEPNSEPPPEPEATSAPIEKATSSNGSPSTPARESTSSPVS